MEMLDKHNHICFIGKKKGRLSPPQVHSSSPCLVCCHVGPELCVVRKKASVSCEGFGNIYKPCAACIL